jgi:hypothetical protein
MTKPSFDRKINSMNDDDDSNSSSEMSLSTRWSTDSSFVEYELSLVFSGLNEVLDDEKADFSADDDENNNSNKEMVTTPSLVPIIDRTKESKPDKNSKESEPKLNPTRRRRSGGFTREAETLIILRHFSNVTDCCSSGRNWRKLSILPQADTIRRSPDGNLTRTGRSISSVGCGG